MLHVSLSVPLSELGLRHNHNTGLAAGWLEHHYVGQRRGWYLFHCCLTHRIRASLLSRT